MNNFTKKELEDIELVYRSFCGDGRTLTELEQTIMEKLKSTIDNYWLPENVELIGTGQLLFHNKESSTAIIPKINKQFDSCDNNDEKYCFRIDWKIIYGKMFA